jgi:hypothetical protein
MGLAVVALIGLSGAGAASQGQAAAGVPLAAAEPSSGCGCQEDLSCPCACSPLAGAWIAQLSAQEDQRDVQAASEKDSKDGKSPTDSKKPKRILKTFKFAPVNAKCDKFVVNVQAITRPEKVVSCFPKVTDLTEFVGIACKDESDEVNFTAISFGVDRAEDCDETVFIAVLSGTIALPDDWGKDRDSTYKCKCCKESCKESKCSCKTGDYSSNHGHPGKCDCCANGCKYADCECKTGKFPNKEECKEPEELCAELTVAYFKAEQDKDGDGFPDSGEKPVICLSFDAKLKRVELQPQCKPTKDLTTPATADAKG